MLFALVLLGPDIINSQSNCFFDNIGCGKHGFCCTSNNGPPKCKCDPGYSGSSCNIKEVTAAPISPSQQPPCEKDSKTCINGTWVYDPCNRTCYCHCQQTGAYGENCELAPCPISYFCNTEPCPTNYVCGRKSSSHSGAFCECVPRPRVRPGCLNGGWYNTTTKLCNCTQSIFRNLFTGPYCQYLNELNCLDRGDCHPPICFCECGYPNTVEPP